MYFIEVMANRCPKHLAAYVAIHGLFFKNVHVLLGKVCLNLMWFYHWLCVDLVGKSLWFTFAVPGI